MIPNVIKTSIGAETHFQKPMADQCFFVQMFPEILFHAGEGEPCG